MFTILGCTGCYVGILSAKDTFCNVVMAVLIRVVRAATKLAQGVLLTWLAALPQGASIVLFIQGEC